MPRVQTFDHCGFMVQDIPRAHKFYGQLFGAKPLWMANLNLNVYSGWPIISFVDMGAHRFELCLAMKPLPAADPAYPLPRIGFSLSAAALEALERRLDELEIPHEPAKAGANGLPIDQTLQVRDPDGNLLDMSVMRDGREGPPPSNGVIPLTDLSHIVLEVTDLDVAERFYTQVLGLEVIQRDGGDLGNGRLALANATGQLLLLEKVPELSPRSRFRGPDASTAPDPEGYCGAHLAMTLSSLEEYDEMYAALRAWGVQSDGDIRKGERPSTEKSDYFYDPAGNRIQLVASAKP
ncbi:MAG TPA: VOC family protein [Chloroflexota bacterium]|nr:VOC family protein [Chloroflexota bacterium]